jgi:hypothetical protein
VVHLYRRGFLGKVLRVSLIIYKLKLQYREFISVQDRGNFTLAHIILVRAEGPCCLLLSVEEAVLLLPMSFNNYIGWNRKFLLFFSNEKSIIF